MVGTSNESDPGMAIDIGSMVLLYMVTWIPYMLPSIYPKCQHIYQHHGSYGIDIYIYIWVWVNTYIIRYIFSGMNIHKSQLFWGSRGTRVFDPSPYQLIFSMRSNLSVKDAVHSGGGRSLGCRASERQGGEFPVGKPASWGHIYL